MPDDTGRSYEAEALGQRNHAELLALRHGWDEAYRISVDWPSSWSAARLDNGITLMADSADALLRLIIEDYSAHPVPRREKVSDD
jgi:hypothetical protein